ncbi:hypothetical protein [Paenibacillus harenae]|uniref:hypothetical protein n=1 Tax=Paenibacillus harenae TaxID=306543 RepID=UPI0012EB256A|nr:hypothetical protein [Paenibacillus harenae]
MATITLPAQELPLSREADVLVVGVTLPASQPRWGKRPERRPAWRIRPGTPHARCRPYSFRRCSFSREPGLARTFISGWAWRGSANGSLSQHGVPPAKR